MSAITSVADIVARLAAPPRRSAPAYIAGQHCPGCGRQQWLLGRSTAECAFCDFALPLSSNPLNGACSPDFQGEQ